MLVHTEETALKSVVIRDPEFGRISQDVSDIGRVLKVLRDGAHRHHRVLCENGCRHSWGVQIQGLGFRVEG